MMRMEIYKGEGTDNKVRDIEVNGNNFLLVQNGEMGPIYDTDDFRYLKIDDKHVIRQQYMDTVRRLYEKFDKYLYTLWPDLICFMVDEAWEPSEKMNRNSAWKIDIVKANKLFTGVTGYEYIIKMRQHWIDKWSEAQLHAAIMSQLLRIDNERGIIYKYTEDFQSKLVATFGAKYLEPGTIIDDLLSEDTPAILRGFRIASGQVTMEEVMADTAADGEEADDEATA